MITNLDIQSFKKEIINYDQGANAPYEIKKNSVIEFYLEACPPCQAMSPIYEEASKEYPDINFFRVEASQYPELAALYDIQGTPAFIFIPLKGQAKMMMGEMSLKEFTELLLTTFKH